MRINPGINATISAVTISGGRMTEMPIRAMPLPVMTSSSVSGGISGNFMSDVSASEQQPLSEETSKMLRNTMMPRKAPAELRKPRIFTVDLQAPSGGEDSELFRIVSDSFVKRDWDEARMGLVHYLSLPRSKDVEARARFYLGQTLYFTGNYTGALFEFLSIKSEHPVEANAWIDTILSAMVF
jgi:TolA-binding protein